MISVGILGGSGYTGKKLIQLCSDHPLVEEYSIYGNSSAFGNVFDIFPELNGIVENSVIKNIQDISFEHDVYFIALPHGEALNYVPALFEKDKKIERRWLGQILGKIEHSTETYRSMVKEKRRF